MKKNESFNDFDFSKFDKILSEELPDYEKKTGIQDIMVIEVSSLKEGIKKACELFETEEEEIEYEILEGSEDFEKNKNEVRRIEFRKKILTGKPVLKFSDDNLSVEIKDIFPKNPDNIPTSYTEIFNMMNSANIKYGIKSESIINSVMWVRGNFDKIENVIVAEGKPPGKGRDAEYIEGVFRDIEEISYKKNLNKTLLELFNLKSPEEISKNSFPVYFVKKGEKLAVSTLPVAGTGGIDVFGEKIEPVMGRMLFESDDNVFVIRDVKKVNYVAEKTGYIEYLDGRLNIISPVWIDDYGIKACFIKLPLKSDFTGTISSWNIADLINETGLTTGLLDDQSEQINKCFKNRNDLCEFILLAEGVFPIKGKNGYLELFFDKNVGPGSIKEDGSIDFHEKDRGDAVKANQLIAVKYFQTKGKPGITVTGKPLQAEEGSNIFITGLNNIRTVKQKTKVLYYSTIDGIVDFLGDSGISVNHKYEIDGDVDSKTGNILFDGNVFIKGSVQPGFNVIADGDIIISGSLNNKSVLKSGGNIIIKSGVFGRNDLIISAKGDVAALFIQGAQIKAGGDVLIQEYIFNSTVKARGKVYTPLSGAKKNRGSIIGSDVCAAKCIIANSIGSDDTANTKIAVGFDKCLEDDINELKEKSRYCEAGIKKMSETLRIGYNDISNFKSLLKKLPETRQRPVIEMFKKLNQLIKVRQKLSKHIKNLLESAKAIPLNAKIVARDTISPKVLIQIGDNTIKTETDLVSVEYFLDEEGKTIISQPFDNPLSINPGHKRS